MDTLAEEQYSEEELQTEVEFVREDTAEIDFSLVQYSPAPIRTDIEYEESTFPEEVPEEITTGFSIEQELAVPDNKPNIDRESMPYREIVPLSKDIPEIMEYASDESRYAFQNDNEPQGAPIQEARINLQEEFEMVRDMPIGDEKNDAHVSNPAVPFTQSADITDEPAITVEPPTDTENPLERKDIPRHIESIQASSNLQKLRDKESLPLAAEEGQHAEEQPDASVAEIKTNDVILSTFMNSEDIFHSGFKEALLPQEAEKEAKRPLRVVEEKGKVVISIQESKGEDEEVNTDAAEVNSITSISELSKALELSVQLLKIPDNAFVREKNTEEKEEGAPDVRIMVSEGILELAKHLSKRTRLSEDQAQEEIMPEGRRIILESGDDVSSQLVLDQEELIELQESVAFLEALFEKEEYASEKENGLQVAQQEGRVILSASLISIESTDEAASAQEAVPIATIAELGKAFDIIETFLFDRQLPEESDMLRSENGEKENPAEMMVIVSDDILKLIYLLHAPSDREHDSSEQEEDVVKRPRIIFSTEGEDKKQILIEEEQFIKIRELLSALSPSPVVESQDSRSNNLQEQQVDERIDSTLQELEVQLHNPAVEPTLVVSEAMLRFIVGEIETIKEGKMSKEKTLFSAKTKKEIVIKTAQSLENLAEERRVVIDLDKLKKLMKLYAKKYPSHTSFYSQSDEPAPEELIHGNSLLRRGYIRSDWYAYQELLFLIGVLDQIDTMQEAEQYSVFQPL